MHLKGMKYVQLPDFHLNHVVEVERLKKMKERWRKIIQTQRVV